MRFRVLPVVVLGLAVMRMTTQAEPVISEFVAKNLAGIVDEDAGHGDWVEIHNPTAVAQDMNGWYLTDSATNKTKWCFPAVTIEAGGFVLVWADNKNRRVPGSPLHANFALDNSGEYLGLIRPDGVTVQQEFGPVFPPQDADRSYGLLFNRTLLLAEAAAADYRVPTSAAGLAANWKTAAVSPSGWTLKKPTGLGFGLTEPGMTITVRAKNTATGYLDNQSAAALLLTQPSGHADIAYESVSILPVCNVLGNGGDGHYGSNQLVPAWAQDDYVYQGKGTLTIPTAGVWTFGVNSDDGGRILIDGVTVMDDPNQHGPEDHLGSVTLTAGSHTFEVWYWERAGGDEGEFYASAGSYTAWTSAMRLVGDTANGGLACFTTPIGVSGSATSVRTNIEVAMRNVNASVFARLPFTASTGSYTSLTLLMRYNDGFSAWLNGAPLASSNSPATLAWNSNATAARTNPQSLTTSAFNITAALPSLVNGSNLLAVQGLNLTAADGTFLLLPEIVAGSLPAPPVPGYFNSPTPAAINSAVSALGKVASLTCNPPRGVYPDATVTSTPFNVTLATTTPATTIRYTIDGTLPTASNGTLYTGPLPITQTTTLRAAAFRAGWETSKVSTHSYILPVSVLSQSPTGLPPTANWPTPDGSGKVNGQCIDYGMDPDIVNSTDETIGGAAQVQSALRAIPSMSIVMPNFDLFDTATGIYVNPSGRGLAWERACSIEWLNDPAGGFQEDCGVRTRGGFSRTGDNPKHAFHFYFRSEYGNGMLEYPLLGTVGTRSFNQFDVRTSQNYSWSFGGDGNNTFLREEFCRQTQLDMGMPGSHVRYCQVYINGQYWGLYDIDERTEADFCSAYIGGTKENWDVVKSEQDSGYITGATDGNTDAWELLFAKANPLVTPGTYTRRTLTATEYHDMMGLGPDGVTPNGSLVLLDPDSLIDYMLNIFWTGNLDASTSLFLGETGANNWFGGRDRTGKRGFTFFVHDAEHTLFNTAEDRTGPFNRAISDAATYSNKRTYYNPMFLHADLLDVPAYRQRWHNRVQRHLCNGGALSPAACTQRVNRLAAVVESVIIAESARWGDAKTSTPFTRANWRAARDYLLQTYIPQRTANVIAQLRADGLYPAVDGVDITPQGGYVTSASQINMQTAGAGTIYYTINGGDPLLSNGSRNPSALVFATGGVIRDSLIADGSAGAGATWKYRDPSIDLGSSDIVAGHASWSSTNWKHPAYIDSNAGIWKNGDTELGAGDGPERTIINIGPSGARYPAVYFRKKFTVANPGQYTGLELEVKRDDGAIIYINGHEVGRSNMPSGAVGYSYTGLGTTDEEFFFPVPDTRLVPSALVAGENTIAVEIHQLNSTSSDIGFDLRLRGVRTVNNSAVTLPAGLSTLRARAYDGTNWGALSEVVFPVDAVPANAGNLAVSEIHYHPAESSPAELAAGYDDNDGTFFEYLELMNIGTQRLDLMGVTFGTGISWTFDATATTPRLLLPGQRIVLAGNLAGYAMRYGTGAQVAGQFGGNLDNSGERITLYNSSGTLLRDFTYDDAEPWPRSPDGAGPSLVLSSPLLNPDPNIAANWRASYVSGGTPGGKDSVSLAEYLSAHGQTDPAAVPGHDGLSNFLAYASGNDLQPFCRRALLTTEASASYPSLEYTRRRNTEDTSFTVQASLDLADWSVATSFVSQQDNSDGTETVRVRTNVPLSAHPRQYLRLRVTQP